MYGRQHKTKTAAALAALLILGCAAATAGDLDDGIGIDDKIDDSLQSEPNILFIVNHAKAKARQGSSDAITNGGVGNISIGAGTDLQGATIINLSDNEGAAVVSE